MRKFTLSVLFVIIALGLFGFSEDTFADSTLLFEFGSLGSGDGEFTFPRGITTNSTGYIFVADVNNNRIQVFDPSGNFQLEFGSFGSGDGQFSFPIGIAVNNSGNIYVADVNNNRIQVFDPSGNFEFKFGSSGSDDGQFAFPRGIAVDNSGNIFVVDGNNNRIQVFDSSGSFLSQFGSFGSGDGQFNSPIGVAVDNSDNIYVADTNNNRIQVFDSSGSFLSQFGSFGSGDGEFNSPRKVAVDNSGNIYVGDTSNHRIQVFDSSGSFLSKFGSFGSGDGQFIFPSGIAVDNSDNIYVADTNNNRVQILSISPTLTILKEAIGGFGTFEIQNTNSTGTQSHLPFANNGYSFPITLEMTPGESQSLTEIVPTGWVQTGGFCSVNGVDISGNLTSFTPSIGDDVVCKFTNELNIATLTIIKESVDGAGTFEIQNSNSTGTRSHFLTTFGIGGSNFQQGTITPGELQSLSEIVPFGWVQTGGFCSVNGVDISGNLTSFTPSIGDDVICKFTNEKSLADISVVKSVNATAPLEGDVVRYTLTATNTGPQDATGVQVTDFLPAGVTHITNSTTQGTWSFGVWNIGNLDINDSATSLIDVLVNSGTGGSTITNIANLTASDVTDPNPSNNGTSVVITPLSLQGDNDNDGIENAIDTAPLDENNEAFDDGNTDGIIITRGDQILTITDELYPLGIRIVTDPTGGTIPAEISVCGGVSQTFFAAASEVVGTCGSVTWDVISGEIEATLVSIDGETAEISLDAGDEFFFDDDTFTLESITGTSEVLLTGDDGTVSEVSIPENNSITFEPETSTITAPLENTDPIVVIIDGTETVIEPGETETTLSPRTIKENALTTLEGLLPQDIDKKTEKYLENAIKSLQKSLDDKLWVDNSHLVFKEGKKVFKEERKAVKLLEKIIKKDKETSEFNVEISNVILTLVDADAKLATIALDDAQEFAGDKKADKQIKKAEKEITKAEKALTKEKFEKTIKHYEKAWRHAIKAQNDSMPEPDDEENEDEED